MNYGFVKVASAIPKVKVADCLNNSKEINNLINKADEANVELVVFPELCITGSTCGDLFKQRTLLNSAQKALMEIMDNTRNKDIIAIVGFPYEYKNMIFNMAAIIHNGHIENLVPKTNLTPLERNWFMGGECLGNDFYSTNSYSSIKFAHIQKPSIWASRNFKFAIEFQDEFTNLLPQSNLKSLFSADIIVCMGANVEYIGRHNFIKEMMNVHSKRCTCGYIYASSGYGESTTDAVYGGSAMIYENGELLKENELFQMDSQLIITEIDVEKLRNRKLKNPYFLRNDFNTLTQEFEEHEVKGLECENKKKNKKSRFTLTRSICPTPFVPQGRELDERCNEVFNIQVAGLCKRIEHTYSRTAIIGISGGLDSTLALLVCVKAFDRLGRSRKDIVGVTMPGFGTTGRTYNNALQLMHSLGVTIREISIKEACMQHFSDIGHDINNHDVTYENSQARERTQILMDVANQLNGMVIGTGDLSELALGWATYNGDHMSMYGVNASVPKTLIQSLVLWIADNHVDESSATTLRDIVDTPISPELIPADEQGNIKQKTEDLVGPYELHDFFLYHLMRNGFSPRKIFYLAQHAFEGKYNDEVIKKWLTTFCRRFFNQQFKRSCLPDGPKVGSVSLSPRGDWHMPSDACSTEWLSECDKI
ncbi:MAG: NAD(+) synthase [Bacteroidaceae bacterium]|nr:NAD(+) synthase [Bacteroidaceae bacterium]